MPTLSKPDSGKGSKSNWRRLPVTKNPRPRRQRYPLLQSRSRLLPRLKMQSHSRRLLSRITLASGGVALRRDKDHCKFVASQPCIVCGRTPSEAHHIRFAQPRALGRKVSDEYTVPIFRLHHRELHRYGDEASWWAGANIDPLPIALELWRRSKLTFSLSATLSEPLSDAIPPLAVTVEREPLDG